MKHILLTFCLLLAISYINAQTVYTYQFNNTLHTSNGGPDLKAVCNPTYSPHTFANLKGIIHTVCHYDKSCGFMFTDTANVLSSGAYTIEMYFAPDITNGYAKLIDYKSLTDDNGLYDNNTACTFRGPGTVSGEFFSSGKYSFVTITRDGNSKEVKMYVDGKFVDGFTDSEHDYAVYDGSKTIRFFQDDTYSNGTECSSGNIALLKIYNSPIDEKTAIGHYAALRDTSWFKPVMKHP